MAAGFSFEDVDFAVRLACWSTVAVALLLLGGLTVVVLFLILIFSKPVDISQTGTFLL
jgi:hypothetical protein